MGNDDGNFEGHMKSRHINEQVDADAQYQKYKYYRYSDPKKAMDWLFKAAEQGHAEAQHELGVCFEYGDPYGTPLVEKNRNMALYWYGKAAEQGNVEWQYKLAEKYEEGVGGVISSLLKINSDAIHWYRKAAEQGHADAQYKLADSYYNGNGVEKNFSEAQYWYSKAADHVESDWKGYSHSAEAREMANKLNSSLWCGYYRISSFGNKILIFIAILVILFGLVSKCA